MKNKVYKDHTKKNKPKSIKTTNRPLMKTRNKNLNESTYQYTTTLPPISETMSREDYTTLSKEDNRLKKQKEDIEILFDPDNEDLRWFERFFYDLGCTFFVSDKVASIKTKQLNKQAIVKILDTIPRVNAELRRAESLWNNAQLDHQRNRYLFVESLRDANNNEQDYHVQRAFRKLQYSDALLKRCKRDTEKIYKTLDRLHAKKDIILSQPENDITIQLMLDLDKVLKKIPKRHLNRTINKAENAKDALADYAERGQETTDFIENYTEDLNEHMENQQQDGEGAGELTQMVNSSSLSKTLHECREEARRGRRSYKEGTIISDLENKKYNIDSDNQSTSSSSSSSSAEDNQIGIKVKEDNFEIASQLPAAPNTVIDNKTEISLTQSQQFALL